MQLTEHFTLEELITSEIAARHGLDNNPSLEVVANLERLARFLEEVRKILGKPIMINSAYRAPAINEAVKGSKSSQHLLGCAADIRVPNMTPDEVVKAIIASNLQYDQLIREFDSWTHVSITNDAGTTPRNQTLIIDKQGTRPYA